MLKFCLDSHHIHIWTKRGIFKRAATWSKWPKILKFQGFVKEQVSHCLSGQKEELQGVIYFVLLSKNIITTVIIEISVPIRKDNHLSTETVKKTSIVFGKICQKALIGTPCYVNSYLNLKTLKTSLKSSSHLSSF